MRRLHPLPALAFAAAALLTLSAPASGQSGSNARAEMRQAGLSFVHEVYAGRVDEDIDLWLAPTLENRGPFMDWLSNPAFQFHVGSVVFADAESDLDALASMVAPLVGAAPEDMEEVVELLDGDVVRPLQEVLQSQDLIVIVLISTEGMGGAPIPYYPLGHLLRVREGMWEVVRIADMK